MSWWPQISGVYKEIGPPPAMHFLYENGSVFFCGLLTYADQGNPPLILTHNPTPDGIIHTTPGFDNHKLVCALILSVGVVVSFSGSVFPFLLVLPSSPHTHIHTWNKPKYGDTNSYLIQQIFTTNNHWWSPCSTIQQSMPKSMLIHGQSGCNEPHWSQVKIQYRSTATWNREQYKRLVSLCDRPPRAWFSLYPILLFTVLVTYIPN